MGESEGYKSGVRGNQRAKEGVAILMSERMWSLVVDQGEGGWME